MRRAVCSSSLPLENTIAATATRWEWRIFGDRLHAAQAWLAGHERTGSQESDETYFLGGPGAIAKLRFALMDLKVLREVDEHGLERWEPVLKAEFPLSGDELAIVCSALEVPLPRAGRDRTTLEEFTRDLAGPGGSLVAVGVHKRRVRYALDGCTLELTDVTASGTPMQTLAIEAGDRAAVVALVGRMGFRGWTNMNYGRELGALARGEPRTFAVIDVGTNSVKFHVGSRDAAGQWHAITDRAEVTRLGEGLEAGGAIRPGALARTTAALASMVDEARSRGVRAIAAVGTAGLRQASNQAEVLAAFERAAGVAVEVISGADEARLAYLAVVTWLGLGTDRVVVFDTGGGSSQFTFGRGASVDERFSLDVGAVRYTERFGLAGAVGGDVVAAVLDALGTDLSRLDGRPAPGALVGMGGATTNIAAVMHRLATYDAAVVQGSRLTRAEVDRQVALYAGLDAPGRRGVVGLQPARAEVILAGACIIRTVMAKLGVEALTVSDRGLRHGVLVERFGS